MLRDLNRQILRSVFRIHEGEGLRAAFMLLYSIAAVGGVIITGQLASRALFLSSLPQSAIPFKFILPPVVLMAVTAAYTRVAGRFRCDKLLILSYSLILLGVVFFRLLLETAYRQEFFALCSLFVFFDVISSLVIIQFWTFASEIFNPREAKRLFGLIGGGSAVSNVLFGGVLGSIASAIAPENLMFIVMGSLVVCMGCVRVLAGRYSAVLSEAGEGEEEERPASRKSILADLREVLQTPLVASMSAILILVVLASSIGDYQLDLALQSRYGENSQGMVGFLGQFRFWAGLGAVLLQFFLAGRLLERFGVVAALLLLPSAMVASSGVILLAGGVLLAAALPRACDVVWKYTINDAAFNLLYLPVDAQLRTKARAILDGMFKPPMVSLLGLVFLLAGQSGSSTIVHWAYVMLVLVVLWIGLVVRAGRQYVAALSQSIQQRRLDPDRVEIDLSDESSIRVIRETLRSPDAMQVVHALSLLPGIPRVDWTPHVALLLDHPHPEVRVLALEFLAEGEAALYAEPVHARLRDPEEQVRAAAVEALCALGKLQIIPQVLPFLQDPAPRIRGAAVLGLIKHMGLDGFLHVAEHLKDLLTSADPRARLEGVRVLEVLQVPSFYHPLIPLLDDESVEVQVGTIRAAARIKTPELVPYLVPKLAQPLTRWPATEALAWCIGQDLSVVEELLQDEHQLIAARRQLTYVLRQHPSPQAVQLLTAQLDADDDPLRAAAGAALLELRDRGIPVYPAPLRAVLSDELRRAYELHVVRHDLQGVHLLLDETVEIRIAQAQDRILCLLDLLYPEISATWMREPLAQRSTRLQASALELIDNVVDREVGEFLLPLFGPSGEERLAVARRQLHIPHRPQAERLRNLTADADTWLRSCALHAIGARGLVDLGPAVHAAVSAGEPVVRETALVAYGKLYGLDELRARFQPRLLAERFPAGLLVENQAGEYTMALSTLEKVFFLKSAPLFEQIPGEDIVGMVPIINQVDLKRGETFIRKGEEGDCLYILVDGEVMARVAEGEEYIIRSGEVIGERAVLSEQPRSADCTALTDVVALRIDKQDFWKLMNEQPKITIEILKVLVDRYI